MKSMPSFVRRAVTVALVLGFGCFGAVAAHAATPVDDGVIQPGEYASDYVDGPVHIYVTFTADRIYLAVSDKTQGWVAVGLDSNRMNGAKIFMGYYQGTTPSFTEQLGRGHTHTPTDTFTALDHAVLRSGDTTTMELTLDRSLFLKPGDTTLSIIYAVGDDDNITQYHAYRNTMTLKVQ